MAMTMSQRREAYRVDYLRMFAAAKISPDRAKEAAATASAISAGKARYDIVAAATGVPWWFIGLCHNRECSLRFDEHLHNGDKLTARTHNVPAGRPLTGTAPFKWEDSAIDAMRYEGFDKIPVWDETECLLRLEAYNGFGYRGHGVPSPYLWAGTNQTDGRGKYVRDGVFDPNAIDRQLGCVAVMLALRDMGFVLFPGDTAAKTDTAASVVTCSLSPAETAQANATPFGAPAAAKINPALIAAGAGTVTMAVAPESGSHNIMETIMHPIPFLIGLGLLTVLAVLVCDRVIRYKTTPGTNLLSAFENDAVTAASYALMKIGVVLGFVQAWLTAYQPLLSDNSFLTLLHSWWPGAEVDAVISGIGLFLRALTIGKTVPLPTFNAVAPPVAPTSEPAAPPSAPAST